MALRQKCRFLSADSISMGVLRHNRDGLFSVVLSLLSSRSGLRKKPCTGKTWGFFFGSAIERWLSTAEPMGGSHLPNVELYGYVVTRLARFKKSMS
jgi:hypothetical protein